MPGSRVLATALAVAWCCGTASAAGTPQRQVAFALGQETLHGTVFGGGARGVVLADQSDRDRTSWFPFARDLARRGYRVLAFDYGSDFPEREVAAAARELRTLGAKRVVAVGASAGAKASLIAAAGTHPAVAAVVSLSAERYVRRRDVLPYARRLRTPALFVTARDDPFSRRDTPLLERAAASTRKTLLVVPGSDHGVALLASGKVRSAVLAFLARVEPGAAAPRLALHVDAKPSRSSGGRCIFTIRNPLVEAGRQTTCLTSVAGYPSPSGTIRSRGTMTFALRRGTIRARVSIAMRFAADGLHATQRVTGTVTGGTGAYRGRRGTLTGSGTVVDRASGLGHVEIAYRLTWR